MTVATVASPFFERVEFPDDPALPQLPSLFDPEWVWPQIQPLAAGQLHRPGRVRIHHFMHSIGSSATVSYELEWPEDAYLPSEYFVATTRRNGSVQIQRYPEDRRLPGLVDAARPESAIRLANTHVLTMPARRARVQLIRYRPAYRAVLRHSFGRAKLYARVVRPAEFGQFLAAYRISTQSGFAVPGLAGYWADGGVLWFTAVLGRNVRARIRKGKAPDPQRLLNGLDLLWRAPPNDGDVQPFDLQRAYRRALRSFRHNLRDHHQFAHDVEAIDSTLDPFVRSWRPVCMAHNDFYDDQMLTMKGGTIALVDFEEIAPGDPMIDVGNFLAHLRWSSRFARERHASRCLDYYHALRPDALSRFAWTERDLALREAVCLFRICTNAIRHPKADWKDKLGAGLELVQSALG